MIKRVRLELLDGLRGVAAISVLLGHAVGTSMNWLLPHNYLAVDFFFLLSGFVIGGAYEGGLQNGSLSLGRFIKSRLIRLYPLIVLGAALGILGFWRLYEGDRAVVLAAGALLIPLPLAPASEGWMAFPANPPSWSLFYEVIGNLGFALIARHLTHRTLAAIVGLSFLVLAGSALHYGSLNNGAAWPTLLAGAPRFIFSFSAGLLLHRAWKLDRLRLPTMPPWVVAGALLVALQIPTPASITWLYDLAIVVVAFPVLMIVAANTSVKSRVWRIAGGISYPCYILQGGIVVHMRPIPGHFGLTGGWALLAIVAASVAFLILCQLALTLYDEPVRAWLTRRLLGRKVVAETTGPPPLR